MKEPTREDGLLDAEPLEGTADASGATQKLPPATETAQAVGATGVLDRELSLEQQLNQQGLKLLRQQDVEAFNGLRKKHTWWKPNFSGAYFFLTQMDMVNLSGADLSGVHFDSVSLVGANLDNTNFGGADLDGAHLSKASLRGADLSGADLYNACLDKTDLYGANFREASLRETGLYAANLNRADLDEVKNLTAEQLSEAAFKGARNIAPGLLKATLACLAKSFEV